MEVVIGNSGQDIDWVSSWGVVKMMGLEWWQ